MRDLQTDYIGPLPPSKGYALVCEDALFGLTQAFPCCQANQAASITGLVKLGTMYRYPCSTDRDLRSHFKGHDVQDRAKEHSIE